MIKKGNSNNASRVLIGDREVSKVYKGSNLVWQRTPQDRGGIFSSSSKAGDVCFYDRSIDKLIIVPYNYYGYNDYGIDRYHPLGVVVVPGTHNVYGDGSCAIMSMNSMDYDYPATGSTYNRLMYLGRYEDEWMPTNMLDLNGIPYVGINSVGDVSSTIIGLRDYIVKIPSPESSAQICPHDTNTGYSRDYTNYGDDYYGPSPYLSNDLRNPAYYQTFPSSSLSSAFADFDGVGNTKKIVAFRGTKNYNSWKPTFNVASDYPAASCCNMYYTEGTKQGDWYLPAISELVYYPARSKDIEHSMYSLISHFEVGVLPDISDDSMWSSTMCISSYDTCGWDLSYYLMENNYFIVPTRGDTQLQVRAFLRVKI